MRYLHSGRRLLLSILSTAVVPVYAVNPTMTTVPAPVTTTAPAPSPAMTTAPAPLPAVRMLTTASAVINDIQPARCVHRGDAIAVLGSSLGTQSGRQLLLVGVGSVSAGLPLSVSQWSATRIDATVPDTTLLADGQSYAMAIQQQGQSGWASNADKAITICAAAPAATESTPSSATSSPVAGGGNLSASGALPPPPPNLPPTPAKEDRTVETGEVVVVSGDIRAAQELATQVQALGLGIKRRTVLKGLGLVVTVLRAPQGVAAGDALKKMRDSQPNVWADVNHRLEPLGADEKQYGQHLIHWGSAAGCHGKARIGLLDSSIDRTHPALQGSAITERSVLPAGVATAPQHHGTAIAAILAARPDTNGITGLLPEAQLYVATILRARSEKEIDTTAEWLVLGLDWLASQQVSIVNMSLGGPRNLLVEAAIKRLQEHGVLVVAAAGNGGAKGSAVYPAAQPGVIAVTAVDAKRAIYRDATHGDYIAFSAPGVDVWTAAPGGKGLYVSGTSYAVPFVTAAFAAARVANPKADWSVLEKQLSGKALDLGAPGRDPVFGWGLVQAGECTSLSGKRK